MKAMVNFFYLFDAIKEPTNAEHVRKSLTHLGSCGKAGEEKTWALVTRRDPSLSI